MDAQRLAFISDTLCTAAEGGINLWAEMRNVVRDGVDYISYEVRDSEDPRDPWHIIDDIAIETAISKVRDGEVEIRADLARFILKASETNDASYIDADCADCLVQIAAYGEITFS